jgi:membrane protease YdiL (CAAX protease family)
MVRRAAPIHARENQRGLMEPTTTAEASVIPAIPPQPRGIAPVWHTVILLLLLLSLALSGTVRSQKETAVAGHSAIYIVTIVYQWILVGFIAFGVRLRGRTLRDLIGGRWNSVEAVLTDFAIGLGVWFIIICTAAAVVLSFKLQNSLSQSGQHLMKKIAPQTNHELALFMVLAITAGFCEEVIFRGYIQQQFKAWTNSRVIAVLASTTFFGLGHLYQGPLLALGPTFLGLIFAVLAEWRKSLRPGMITHTWQDCLSGVAQHFASKLVH